MNIYMYDGPVNSFGKCVNKKWSAYTRAVSPEKARSNLQYRFKKENGLVARAKIELPGEIVFVN